RRAAAADPLVGVRPARHGAAGEHRLLRRPSHPGPRRAGHRAPGRGGVRAGVGAVAGPARGTLPGVTVTVTPAHDPGLDDQLPALRAELRALGRVVVAFSGGADSAFLAAVANDALGPAAVHAVTAVSPSLAGLEREDCRALAAEWGLRWTPVT